MYCDVSDDQMSCKIFTIYNIFKGDKFSQREKEYKRANEYFVDMKTVIHINRFKFIPKLSFLTKPLYQKTILNKKSS